MGVVDTHCHLDLIEERGLPLEEVIELAQVTKIEALLQIATDLESSLWNRELSGRWQELDETGSLDFYWTVGLHPEAADQIDDLDSIFELAQKHKGDPTFWGLGETGLDYFHTTEYKKEQLESFERHLELAEELGLPIVGSIPARGVGGTVPARFRRGTSLTLGPARWETPVFLCLDLTAIGGFFG
ncbi:MAG: hypothetical protein D6722_18350, partial [Bacteroidetes bacterium]